jgi:branched-chain amino acid transport system substrate-binding protein
MGEQTRQDDPADNPVSPAEAEPSPFGDSRVSRRSLLRGAGAGALTLGAGGLLEACGSSLKGASSGGTGTITIGLVTPLTGAVADFSQADLFVVDLVRQTTFNKGLKIGSKKYKVNIIVKDSQSDPNVASQVTHELATQDAADIVLVTSTPEVTNPVATVCETLGVPCVATVVPWESWYFGRNAKPGQVFTYTTMFFFGIPEFGECFIPMWNRIANDHKIACMWPNDSDGNAFRAGFPPLMKAAGYTAVDGGAYPDGTTDYTSMISKFKAADCQVYQNAPLPPDFNVFWKQAVQQGFRPKIATVAKVLLFPSDVQALGNLVNNVATDAWWAPGMPWKSSFTGQTCAQVASAFTAATGSAWVQSLSNYSLFEVAYTALKSVSDPHDKAELADALFKVNIEGLAGQLDWTSSKNPAPGVVDTPCVGVQWKPDSSSKFGFSMQVVDNTLMPNVPLTGTLEPTNK